MKPSVRAALAVAALSLAPAAHAATAFENFEGAPIKDAPLLLLNTAVGLFTPAPGGAGNLVVSSPGYTNYGAGNNPTTTSILTANGDESFDLALAFAARTVSFDVYLNDFGPATASFFNGATLLGSIGYSAASPNFAANQSFTSFGPLITRFTFISTQGGRLNTGLDNIRITDNAVPEPDAWALMIAGFGLIGAALRRRSAGLARRAAAWPQS